MEPFDFNHDGHTDSNEWNIGYTMIRIANEQAKNSTPGYKPPKKKSEADKELDDMVAKICLFLLPVAIPLLIIFLSKGL